MTSTSFLTVDDSLTLHETHPGAMSAQWSGKSMRVWDGEGKLLHISELKNPLNLSPCTMYYVAGYEGVYQI